MKPTETQSVENKVPSVQDQIRFLKDQLPLKRLQVEAQELNTRFSEMKVREFEAINKLQQIDVQQREAQAKQDEFMKENIIEHIITKEDIDMNPELSEANIVVGQKIGIPKEIYKTLNLSNKVDIDNSPPVVEDKLDEVRPADSEKKLKSKHKMEVVKD